MLTSSDIRKDHWENIYASKKENEVSWFQESPVISLELIAATDATTTSAIVDIGGGASRLVDCLLEQGYERITVLDISSNALATARARIGEDANKVTWIVSDATVWKTRESYDVWHDRAVFHFLTSSAEQKAYVQRLRQALRREGHAIIGTFALDGPEECSGLPVVRYSPESLAAVLGPAFVLVDRRPDEHATPSKRVQKFQFSTFRMVE